VVPFGQPNSTVRLPFDPQRPAGVVIIRRSVNIQAFSEGGGVVCNTYLRSVSISKNPSFRQSQIRNARR
jgi:hypothetical protein